MRGSVIEYQQTNPREPKYLAYFKDIVWRTTSDNDGNDFLEIGKLGCHGHLPLNDAIGVDITETILIDYGFLRINGTSDCITYYRDDFGYIKLDTYGVEHVYMKGKCIKYLHNFQRIFFDYAGKVLYPHVSELPKQEWKSSIYASKIQTADEMLEKIQEIKKINQVDIGSIVFDIEF